VSEPELLAAPDPETLGRLQEMAERRLTPEEFNAHVNAPMSEEERAEILANIEWFMRRYPTPAERLASARRAYAQWARSIPRGK
jgi:hypothetical protein